MIKKDSLRQILIDTQAHWDHSGTRQEVRENFWKLIYCGTLTLGAEVYMSDSERKTVCHSCKSRFCPRCGSKATALWQDDLEVTLPDIPYVGINFTMPNVFWPIFQQNRALLGDLPAIGASAIQHWVKQKYGVRVFLIVVAQTFGGMMNFNCHLHMLLSAGGYRASDRSWISRLQYDKEELMRAWRTALCSYLWVAWKVGAVRCDLTTGDFERLLFEKHEQSWIIYRSYSMSKTKFLHYAGRYMRRAPIPQNHILETVGENVRFRAKKRKDGYAREKILCWPKEQLVDALGEHVPDRYRHGMRYFGLLAPQSKRRIYHTVFALLKQNRRPRPAKLTWPELSLRTFGINPLLDGRGRLMHVAGRLPPLP